MALFYRLSEVAGNLDFLCSLALFAKKSSPESPLMVRCMLNLCNQIDRESVRSATSLLRLMDVSGKTAYLKQIAFIQILAQIGSLVPAEFAVLPIVGQIYFHNCSEDYSNSNESSFTRDVQTRKNHEVSLGQSAKSFLIIRHLFSLPLVALTSHDFLWCIHTWKCNGHMRVEECSNNSLGEEQNNAIATESSSMLHSDRTVHNEGPTGCVSPRSAPNYLAKWKCTYKLMKGISEKRSYGNSL
ncbi:hypothetical protein FBUS_02915 [Fasciolopsis buskii]|uniref:DNA mismatch repair proteins mutS family domain-containing protein n=1 Tax=Fasciolopsis buskii TaxID=27845 RepID=A0A8E0RSH7_9TREM|nr:hypothetical protein FBUS_02915 [Fasciolopsis buski]